jgi:hypothetical protein
MYHFLGIFCKKLLKVFTDNPAESVPPLRKNLEKRIGLRDLSKNLKFLG